MSIFNLIKNLIPRCKSVSQSTPTFQTLIYKTVVRTPSTEEKQNIKLQLCQLFCNYWRHNLFFGGGQYSAPLNYQTASTAVILDLLTMSSSL